MSISRAGLAPDTVRAAAVGVESIPAPGATLGPAAPLRGRGPRDASRSRSGGRRPLLAALLSTAAALAACGAFSDAATRIAGDIEAQAGRLGAAEGASYTIRHATPSRAGSCEGPYRVQFDKVGALVVWCRNEAGETVSSHSTSSHARAVETRETFIVDKPARAVLAIRLERRNGRAVIVDVS